MTETERMEFLGELFLSIHNLYTWELTSEFQVIRSNCPDSDTVARLFLQKDGADEAHDRISDLGTPLILTNSMQVIWILDRSKESGHISGLGPFFSEDSPLREVRKQVRAMHLSKEEKDYILSLLEQLPIIPLFKTYDYAIMLNKALNGENASIADLIYLDLEPPNTDPRKEKNEAEAPVTIHGTYDSEQEMVRAVREGDTRNFKKIMRKMQSIGSMGQIAPKGNEQRLLKNAVIVNIVLFSRAAVEGGLPPDLSFSLADRYMQGVEACRNKQEILDLTLTMQDDYVNRVHKVRENPEISGVSRSVMAWLDTHLEDTVRIGDIAAAFGYSSYYLSRRFKQECGKSINECLREKRLDRAKFQLESTDLPVHEISDTLQFSSPSYFTELFRKAYGASPSTYRAAHRTP